jgi:hypothetical protein
MTLHTERMDGRLVVVDPEGGMTAAHEGETK